jgi:Lon protease-like protein
MSRDLFAPPFEDLPDTLPIFPLTGTILLPRCRLPLNIFEPRYLAMVEAALGASRVIGMIQPVDSGADVSEPEIYRTGCGGRISSFSETDDGRILLILSGMCRFDVVEELQVETPYRQVRVDWEPYRADFEGLRSGEVDRDQLFEILRAYFDARGLDTDWEALETTDDENLVNSLVMSCPFEASEKQILLEAPDVGERNRLMTSLMEMATLDSFDDSGSRPV